jgi:hypothetical protein
MLWACLRLLELTSIFSRRQFRLAPYRKFPLVAPVPVRLGMRRRSLPRPCQVQVGHQRFDFAEQALRFPLKSGHLRNHRPAPRDRPGKPQPSSTQLNASADTTRCGHTPRLPGQLASPRRQGRQTQVHLARTAMPLLLPRRGIRTPGRAFPAAQHLPDVTVEFLQPALQILDSARQRLSETGHHRRVDSQRPVVSSQASDLSTSELRHKSPGQYRHRVGHHERRHYRPSLFVFCGRTRQL